MEAKDPRKGGTPVTIAPERPVDVAPAWAPETLLAAADEVWERLPGYRVEIIAGQLLVTPPPDFAHARALTKITLLAAALDTVDSHVVQGVGVWFGSDEDYAVPDLAIVDADIEERLVAYNCYDPAVFRAVFEVTSRNRSTDLVAKRAKYAAAGIPVYVIVDRKAQVVLVLGNPQEGNYQDQSTHRRGESFKLPESVGTPVEIEVDVALGISETQ
jgi:Uma2 family endonuclease